VDHAAPVRHRQRTGGSLGEGHGLAEVEAGAAAEALGERLALQPLHGQEILAALALAVGDVADDGRVHQRREQRCLLLEARHVAAAARHQHLERHRAPVGEVARAVHATHAAGAGQLQRHEAAPDGSLQGAFVVGGHGGQ